MKKGLHELLLAVLMVLAICTLAAVRLTGPPPFPDRSAISVKKKPIAATGISGDMQESNR